jgi:hypothetical protein
MFLCSLRGGPIRLASQETSEALADQQPEVGRACAGHPRCRN